jgi:hypothetical protein
MRAIAAALALATCCLTTGCFSRQVQADGRNFRHALLEMYTDQVMDNLVRAHKEQPFVQVAYRALVITDTQTVKGNLGNQIDPSNSKSVVQGAAKILAIAHAYTDHLFFGGGGSSDRQMTFKSDPVTGKLDIYDLYAAYAHDPALFSCSDQDPGCAAHIKLKCEGKWYWVPTDAAPIFLQLVLRTTFMRGPDRPPPIYYSTTLISVEPHKTFKDSLVFRFDPKVRNDSGHVIVTLADGRTVRLDVVRTLEDEQGEPLPKAERQGGWTSFLLSTEKLEAKSVKQADLKGRPVQYYSQNYPNLGSRSPEDERLDAALSQYRRAHPAGNLPR